MGFEIRITEVEDCDGDGDDTEQYQEEDSDRVDPDPDGSEETQEELEEAVSDDDPCDEDDDSDDDEGAVAGFEEGEGDDDDGQFGESSSVGALMVGAGHPRRKKKVNRKTKDAFVEKEMGDVQVAIGDIQDILKVFEQNAALAVPLLEGEEQKKVVKQFQQVAVSLVGAQEKLNLIPEVVIGTYNELDMQNLVEDEQNDKQFVALLDEFSQAATKEMGARCSQIGMRQVGRNKTYKRFMDKLNQVVAESGPTSSTTSKKLSEGTKKAAPGKRTSVPAASANPNAHSEGLEALTEYIPTTDPITRKPFEDPYVNKKCGHVYEYMPMMNMIITSGAKMRCPYPGCSNREPVKATHLFKDIDMARKIAQRIQDEGAA